MNHLLRDLAPISDAGWAAIDAEARARLGTYLAARKLVDFVGPAGWSHSASNLGRVVAIDGPGDGVTAAQRRVLPLVELRADFVVARDEMSDVDRGADDVDFADLDRAARAIAVAENTSVFAGYGPGAIAGIAAASPHQPIALGDNFAQYPVWVAQAVNRLLEAGIGGPYGLAMSPSGYTGIIETTEMGDLLFDHLRKILGGPVVWAPGLDGGVVLSLRGGDFVFDCGEDLSVGYAAHDRAEVHLYFEESFSFRVVEPGAAVALQQ